VSTSNRTELIGLCKTRAATCSARLEELKQRGRESIGCTYFQWNELASAYARAAATYRDMARLLARGNTTGYTMLQDAATSAHRSAVRRDQEITGDEVPSAPKRREMSLPQS
jgi:hypothetical protein